MIITLCRKRRLFRVPVTFVLALGISLPMLAGAEDPSAEPGLEQGTTDSLAQRYFRVREELSAQQLQQIPAYCDGMYIGPEVPSAGSGFEQEAAGQTRAESDQGAYWFDDRAILEGNVRITQEGRRMLTSKAEVTLHDQTINLPEPIELQDGEAVISGSGGSADMTTGAATLNDVQYLILEPALRGTASQLQRGETGDWNISDGAFTRCEPGNSSWHVSAEQIQIQKDSIFGIARHAVLRVGDVPVFYAPFIRFPVSDARVSGFLFPTVGYGDEDGLDLSLPYYLNLAPNYDATIIPRYFSRRGSGMEAEARALDNWHSSILSMAFLPKDDVYNGSFNRNDFNELFPDRAGSFRPADRWLLGLQHQGNVLGLSTLVDYTAVSDRDYFHDLGTDLSVSSAIDLERRGELSYEQDGLQVRLWAQRFQRLDEITLPAYQRMPQLDVSYQGQLFGPLRWSLNTEWVQFDRRTKDLTGRDAITGSRTHFEPRLSLPISRSYGYLNLTGGLRLTRYDLDSVQGVEGLPVNFDRSPVRQVGFGSVGGGLYFERALNWFNTDLIQTLEPQLYYLYQGYENQRDYPIFDTSELTFSYRQLFRDNRFAGLDRIGDANQLSAGLTTRFLGAATGREYFRASVGQIAHFEDRRVTLTGLQTESEKSPSSAYVGEVNAHLGPNWSINGTAIWDPHENRIEEAAAAFQYRRDSGRILNVGYRHRAQIGPDINQSDLSFYWPLSDRVSMLARWNYDVDNTRTIEAFTGLEYNDCCWQVRVLARRFVSNPANTVLTGVKVDQGIYLQIVFKGLAGFGRQLESVLQRGIKGYQPEEY